MCCFGATFSQTTSQRALNSLTLAPGRSWQKNGFFFFHLMARQGCFQAGEVEEEGERKKPKKPLLHASHSLPASSHGSPKDGGHRTIQSTVNTEESEKKLMKQRREKEKELGMGYMVVRVT